MNEGDFMGLIQKPMLIIAAGKTPKQIEEYVGRVNAGA